MSCLTYLFCFTLSILSCFVCLVYFIIFVLIALSTYFVLYCLVHLVLPQLVLSFLSSPVYFILSITFICLSFLHRVFLLFICVLFMVYFLSIWCSALSILFHFFPYFSIYSALMVLLMSLFQILSLLLSDVFILQNLISLKKIGIS